MPGAQTLAGEGRGLGRPSRRRWGDAAAGAGSRTGRWEGTTGMGGGGRDSLRYVHEDVLRPILGGDEAVALRA